MDGAAGGQAEVVAEIISTLYTVLVAVGAMGGAALVIQNGLDEGAGRSLCTSARLNLAGLLWYAFASLFGMSVYTKAGILAVNAIAVGYMVAGVAALAAMARLRETDGVKECAAMTAVAVGLSAVSLYLMYNAVHAVAPPPPAPHYPYL